MVELGRKLRTAREQAGLSIEAISARTKIGVPALAALEAGAFERLPGDFYTRAFLKTYAREVRLSPDDIVHEFDAARMPAQPILEEAQARVSARRVRAEPHEWAEDMVEPAAGRHAVQLPRFGKSNVWAGAVFAALALMVGMSVWRQATPNRPAEPGTVATSGVAEAAPAPAATSGHETAPDKLAVDIRPTAEIWVNARADGATAVYKLLKPGDHVMVEAQNELAFRIGNAAAFTYAINGVPGKSVGGAGEVREFTITRANYTTYRR